MTSHDVVARVRRIAGTRRVGHAGTLDPMATGVLVLGVERATKLLTYLVGCDKRYSATIRLGQTTVTDDADGDLVTEAGVAAVSEAALPDTAIHAALAGMTGEIEQVPSAVSAIKVAGVRSYARVRAGEDVVLPARRITVHALRVLAIRRAGGAGSGGESLARAGVVDVDVDVSCSSGTYVRAIARDAGAALGVGGHLVVLRRTAVGGFDESEAVPLETLAALAEPVTMPLAGAVARVLPRRDATVDEARVLAHGGVLATVGTAGAYGVFGPSGEVVAIVRERGGKARPEVVFAPA